MSGSELLCDDFDIECVFLSIAGYLVIWILQVATLERVNKNVYSSTPDSSLVSQVAPFSMESAFAGVWLWTAKLAHFGYYEARCVQSERPLTEPSVLNGRCAWRKKLNELTFSASPIYSNDIFVSALKPCCLSLSNKVICGSPLLSTYSSVRHFSV